MLANLSETIGASRSKRCARSHPGVLTLSVVLTLIAPALRAGADDVTPLRLCADPTNLPFSSDDPSKPGFYLEIGQALGQALGRPVTYTWYKSYFGKRTVRVTLLAKQCDAMIGLPLSDDFMGPAVIFSRKIATQAYALVTAKGQTIGGIDDLKGKRVAVQYESTPQNLLAQRDDIEKITVLSPEEGMKALDQGRADVAFVWGPVAGWLNKTAYNDRYQIQATEGKGLSWDAAIGFAKPSKELRDQIDAILPQLEQTIAGLTLEYGLPNDKPIQFSAAEAATTHASTETSVQPVILAQVSPAQTTGALAAPSPATMPPAAATSAAAAAAPETVDAGKEVFNGTCAHCHGPDAVQSERRIDLRRMHNRYGDDMRSKYWTAVHEGRPSKGMPAWKEVFTDGQLENVYAYLMTVQTPAN
jgi:polar amino acid transport system substrate-binding protein